MYRSFFGPFLAAFVIILFILVLQFLSRYLDELLGKGLENIVLAKVFGYTCITLVTMALPLAVLLSSLLTMGNMGERYELAAMKSAGIGLFKTMRPMFNFTVGVVLMAFFFSFYLMPQANLKLYTLIYDVSKVKPTFNLRANHFYSGIDNFSIHVGNINRDRDMLYKVKVYDHSGEAGNMKITLADSGRMIPNPSGTAMILHLFHGVNHEESMKKEKGEAEPVPQYSRFYYDSLRYEISLTGFNLEKSSENTFKNHQYMLDIIELYKALDSLRLRNDTISEDLAKYMDKYVHTRSDSVKPTSEYNLKPVAGGSGSSPAVAAVQGAHKSNDPAPLANLFPEDKRADILGQAVLNARAVKNYARVVRDRLDKEEERTRKYDIEYQFRFALPLACLVFLFIGAPLGAIVRKGGVGIPIIVSIGFFILFYILMIQGKKLARDGIIPLWIGTWLPILVMSPMSLVFTYQSATDSPLMFSSGAGQFFFRIGKFFGRLNPFRKTKPAPKSANADVWDDVDAEIERREKNKMTFFVNPPPSSAEDPPAADPEHKPRE